jgi:hypothetical protein
VSDDGKTADQQWDDLPATLSKQTGMTLIRERRAVDIWTIGAAAATTQK